MNTKSLKSTISLAREDRYKIQETRLKALLWK